MCINDNSEICNIEKTINSIIRQSVGFEKNIELILMDTCKNKKITSFLTHYDKIYPNNIILKKVKHSNLTQIRKIGIKLASNEIISFINVGDELAIDTLKKIQKFGKKQDKNLNIIVIPLYEYTNGDMIKKYNQFAKNSKIIELNNENNKFLLFNCGTFYRKNLFANVDFTTKNFNGENWYFNWQLLKSNKKIGFVTDHNVSYILNNSNIIAIDESINVLSRIIN